MVYKKRKSNIYKRIIYYKNKMYIIPNTIHVTPFSKTDLECKNKVGVKNNSSFRFSKTSQLSNTDEKLDTTLFNLDIIDKNCKIEKYIIIIPNIY